MSLARLLVGTGSFAQRAQRVADELSRLMSAELVVVAIPDEHRNQLQLVARAGPIASLAAREPFQRGDEGLMGTVLRGRELVFSNDYPSSAHAVDRIARQGIRSGAAVRVGPRKTPLAIITVAHRELGYFSPAARDALKIVSRQMAPFLENARLQESEQSRNIELSTLLSISRALASSRPFERKAASALAELTTAVGANLSIFRVLGPTGALDLIAKAGVLAESTPLRQALTLDGQDPMAVAFREKRTIVIDDVQADPLRRKEWRRLSGSAVFIPLRGREGQIGSLIVRAPMIGHFRGNMGILLEAIADGFGTMIDNARLVDQVQALAMSTAELEAAERERDRIARDMHDGLAQVLAGSRIKAEAASTHLRNGEVAAASREIEDISTASAQLYEEVRATIARLRGGPLSADATLEQLVRHLNRFEEAVGFRTVRNWQVVPEEVVLSAAHAEQVTRIVQESLTNIRKHASATRTGVTIRLKADVLSITVKDNGVGFDAPTVRRSRGGFGLTMMRERAAEINGRIRITTRPGHGTTVSLSVPQVRRIST